MKDNILCLKKARTLGAWNRQFSSKGVGDLCSYAFSGICELRFLSSLIFGDPSEGYAFESRLLYCCGKQCGTENAYTGQQYNIFIWINECSFIIQLFKLVMKFC